MTDLANKIRQHILSSLLSNVRLNISQYGTVRVDMQSLLDSQEIKKQVEAAKELVLEPNHADKKIRPAA